MNERSKVTVVGAGPEGLTSAIMPANGAGRVVLSFDETSLNQLLPPQVLDQGIPLQVSGQQVGTLISGSALARGQIPGPQERWDGPGAFDREEIGGSPWGPTRRAKHFGSWRNVCHPSASAEPRVRRFGARLSWTQREPPGYRTVHGLRPIRRESAFCKPTMQRGRPVR